MAPQHKTKTLARASSGQGGTQEDQAQRATAAPALAFFHKPVCDSIVHERHLRNRGNILRFTERQWRPVAEGGMGGCGNWGAGEQWQRTSAQLLVSLFDRRFSSTICASNTHARAHTHINALKGSCELSTLVRRRVRARGGEGRGGGGLPRPGSQTAQRVCEPRCRGKLNSCKRRALTRKHAAFGGLCRV